jgi:hypothetical protein
MAPVMAQMSPASQGEGQLLKHPLKEVTAFLLFGTFRWNCPPKSQRRRAGPSPKRLLGFKRFEPVAVPFLEPGEEPLR